MKFEGDLDFDKVSRLINTLIEEGTTSQLNTNLTVRSQFAYDTDVSRIKIYDGTAVRTILQSNDIVNTAFGPGWNGVTDKTASLDALYDVINSATTSGWALGGNSLGSPTNLGSTNNVDWSLVRNNIQYITLQNNGVLFSNSFGQPNSGSLYYVATAGRLSFSSNNGSTSGGPAFTIWGMSGGTTLSIPYLDNSVLLRQYNGSFVYDSFLMDGTGKLLLGNNTNVSPGAKLDILTFSASNSNFALRIKNSSSTTLFRITEAGNMFLSGIFTDTSANNSINTNSRLLIHTNGNTIIDWTNGYAYKANGVTAIDWNSSSRLIDDSSKASINWTLRNLYANNGTTAIINWNSTTTGLIYSTDFSSGYVARSIPDVAYVNSIGSPTINSTFYVSVDFGDDATAVKGKISKPYKNIKTAVLAASPGDTIWVFAGLYDEDSIPTISNLRIHLEDGVRIIPTASGGIVSIFSDLVTGATAGGATDFRITGKGEIINIGQSGNDTSAICASYPNSKYYIECKKLSSFESWNGAYFYLKEALLDIQFSAYSGGIAYLENCNLINYGSVDTILTYGSSSAPGRISFYNCYFEKNSVNAAFLAAPTSEGFGFDGPEILHIFSTDSINYIFDKCTFVQNRSGYDCIIVQSTSYDNSYNSTLQFHDCKFFNIDPTKKAITFTTDQYGPTSSLPGGFARAATVGSEDGELKWYFSNNISNVDVDNVNTTFFITNELVGVTPLIVDSNFTLIKKYIG